MDYTDFNYICERLDRLEQMVSAICDQLNCVMVEQTYRGNLGIRQPGPFKVLPRKGV